METLYAIIGIHKGNLRAKDKEGNLIHANVGRLINP
jgi:hypothetical protein